MLKASLEYINVKYEKQNVRDSVIKEQKRQTGKKEKGKKLRILDTIECLESISKKEFICFRSGRVAKCSQTQSCNWSRIQSRNKIKSFAFFSEFPVKPIWPIRESKKEQQKGKTMTELKINEKELAKRI